MFGSGGGVYADVGTPVDQTKMSFDISISHAELDPNNMAIKQDDGASLGSHENLLPPMVHAFLVPSVLAPVNLHPRQTRPKCGIFKLKIYAVELVDCEPLSID